MSLVYKHQRSLSALWERSFPRTHHFQHLALPISTRDNIHSKGTTIEIGVPERHRTYRVSCGRSDCSHSTITITEYHIEAMFVHQLVDGIPGMGTHKVELHFEVKIWLGFERVILQVSLRRMFWSCQLCVPIPPGSTMSTHLEEDICLRVVGETPPSLPYF